MVKSRDQSYGSLIEQDISNVLIDGEEKKYTFVNILTGYRFTDVTDGVTWQHSDYQRIQKEFALIRVLLEQKRIDVVWKREQRFYEQLARSQNDQTSEYEPIEITRKWDKIPNAGRTRGSELITGYTTLGFDFMAIGTSTVAPVDGDDRLLEEVGRVNSRATGYVSPAGAVIKHVGTFPPGFPSGDYWEAAPVDMSDFSEEQSIWARVVFPINRPVHHDINEDFFTIHHATFTTSSA